jgi:hypothetical protein
MEFILKCKDNFGSAVILSGADLESQAVPKVSLYSHPAGLDPDPPSLALPGG